VIVVDFRMTKNIVLIRLKVSQEGTQVTMPVKYFAPKVTVKLCIIDLFLLEITVVKK
jgi:hypothetical protein